MSDGHTLNKVRRRFQLLEAAALSFLSKYGYKPRNNQHGRKEVPGIWIRQIHGPSQSVCFPYDPIAVCGITIDAALFFFVPLHDFF